MKFTAKSEEETAKAAQDFARKLKGREMIMLHGPLGGGKTTFARALIRALNGETSLEVPSPTYTLLQTYDTPKGAVNHYDLYRLKSAEEIYELGWEESVANGITIVEWPERLGSLMPANRTDINIVSIANEPDARAITITKVGG
jgi:tRNA threonylcarbamoyl adenosine modification protein YjeE